MSPDAGKRQSSPAATATSTATTTPQPTETVTTTATLTPSSTAPSITTRPTGDLDTGSVTHKVAVGAFSAVIVYYTGDDARGYRNSSTKTIRVAVHIEDADGQNTILVNNFVATADDGTTRAIVKQDSRTFAITPPQSYNSVVTIPASSDQSTALTLIVELGLSLQITPTSTLYSAQTALDSIVLPLLIGTQS